MFHIDSQVRTWPERIFTLLLLMLGLACATGLMIATFSFMFYPLPSSLNLVLRDWDEINFTPVQSPDHNINGKYVFDWTNAGVIEAEGKYLWTGPTGARLDPPPAQWHVRTTFEIKDALVTVIDIGELRPLAVRDDKTGNYRLELYSSQGRTGMSYERPFGQIPQALQQKVIYKGIQPATFSWKPIPVDNHPGKSGLPNTHFLSDGSIYFGLNLRPNCDTRMLNEGGSRYYGRILNIVEQCEKEVALAPGLQSQSRVNVVPFSSTEFPDPVLLMIPEFYEVRGVDFHLANTEDHYIFIISGKLIWMNGLSDGQFQMAIFSDSDQPPRFSARPTTHVVGFVNPIGTVSTGIKRNGLDLADNLLVTFSEWPHFRGQPNTVRDELGKSNSSNYLFGSGKVDKVTVNGEELVQSRWQMLPGEIQGAIVTLFVTGFAYLSLAVWRRRNPERRDPTLTKVEKVPVALPNEVLFNHPVSIDGPKLSAKEQQRAIYISLTAVIIACMALLKRNR